jgi:hypothetical protein
MPCCRYICCPCLLCCCRGKKKKEEEEEEEPATTSPPTSAPTDPQLVSASVYHSLHDNKKNSNCSPTDAPAVQTAAAAAYAASVQDQQDYEDLQYLATKRAIRVTIRTSTKAGVAAGLSVMAGTLVAGPVGAVAGGAVGTALAASVSKNVVPLNKLLDQTPPSERKEVLRIFNEAFKDEFVETIQDSPELKLLLSGHSPLGVVRYMVERDLIKSDKLGKLDKILKKVI